MFMLLMSFLPFSLLLLLGFQVGICLCNVITNYSELRDLGNRCLRLRNGWVQSILGFSFASRISILCLCNAMDTSVGFYMMK